MAKDHLIRLSVHPCIRTYLLYHYAEPFFVTERGYAPGFIFNALEHVPKVAPAKVVRKDKIRYGAFIGVMVGETTLRKKGGVISGDNVKRFNEVMLDLIHEEMYRLIRQLNREGAQVDQTIREFQAMYGFTEDDLPFENLKRWYYRERQRLDNRAAERRVVHPQIVIDFFEEVPDRRAPIIQPINQNLLFAS